MILAETFDHSIFTQSLARMFATGPDGLLDQGFNATLEVALPQVVSLWHCKLCIIVGAPFDCVSLSLLHLLGQSRAAAM